MKKIVSKIKSFLTNPCKIKKNVMYVFVSLFLCSNFFVLNSSKEVSFLKKAIANLSVKDQSEISKSTIAKSTIHKSSPKYVDDQNEQKQIEVLLLLALPAAGKSEIRNYLANMSDDQRLKNFRVGTMVQIDDFPYVFFMRRISEELDKRKVDPIYYQSETLPLTDPNDWRMLIHLINEDYADIIDRNETQPISASQWLFDRLDNAALKVGKEPKLSQLPSDVREEIADVLEPEANQILNDKLIEISKAKDINTVIIEFSRGGALESQMPLPAPAGYESALPELSDDILQRASILYVDVSPDASRERNIERFDPEKASSILNHKVPQVVMYKDYGCDDMKYLLDISKNENEVDIISHGKEYNIPTYVFDNRADKTSFARLSSDKWSTKSKKNFQDSMKKSFEILKK